MFFELKLQARVRLFTNDLLLLCCSKALCYSTNGVFCKLILQYAGINANKPVNQVQIDRVLSWGRAHLRRQWAARAAPRPRVAIMGATRWPALSGGVHHRSPRPRRARAPVPGRPASGPGVAPCVAVIAKVTSAVTSSNRACASNTVV